MNKQDVHKDMQEVIAEVLREKWGANPYKGKSIKIDDVFILRGSQKIMNIPSDFFDRIENYAVFNGFIEDEQLNICLVCLRNYALAKIKEFGIDDLRGEFIIKQFPIKNIHANFCTRKY